MTTLSACKQTDSLLKEQSITHSLYHIWTYAVVIPVLPSVRTNLVEGLEHADNGSNSRAA